MIARDVIDRGNFRQFFHEFHGLWDVGTAGVDQISGNADQIRLPAFQFPENPVYQQADAGIMKIRDVGYSDRLLQLTAGYLMAADGQNGITQIKNDNDYCNNEYINYI